MRRKLREEEKSEDQKKHKADAAKKRAALLDEYSSVEKVLKLCSGAEACCNCHCLDVRDFCIFCA